ncbi:MULTISPECIES: hypothetical protein [unclassified Streptomyces]|uniref:hypothetical protein n=1 Tax=unclassified Streptomyces TaxID=2593676 RepID=UPI000B6E2777|nr:MULTISPECIES: hypothetical protein [unclassified Streptomyces]MYW99943.1 hypothetical protein [Streptomyces sp. SID8378]SNB89912.1 hypothetical protein SAMN02745831_06206 [Streptomyces sp. PgraA7]
MHDERPPVEAADRAASAPSAADVRDWLVRHLPAAGLTLTDWQRNVVVRLAGSRARQ